MDNLHLDIVTINTVGCTLVPHARCAIVERCMYKTRLQLYAGSGIKRGSCWKCSSG